MPPEIRRSLTPFISDLVRFTLPLVDVVIMVSFFSLFLEKRPDKAAPSSESPTLDRENDAGPSTLPIRPRPASRFLSLRSRSSSRPYDLASHRTDTDSSRRESLKQNGLSSELPKLDLGLDVQLDGDETKNQSGSEELGRRPGLTKEDLEILDRQTLSCEEVALGWKCFGWALWDTG